MFRVVICTIDKNLSVRMYSSEKRLAVDLLRLQGWSTLPTLMIEHELHVDDGVYLRTDKLEAQIFVRHYGTDYIDIVSFDTINYTVIRFKDIRVPVFINGEHVLTNKTVVGSNAQWD